MADGKWPKFRTFFFEGFPNNQICKRVRISPLNQRSDMFVFVPLIYYMHVLDYCAFDLWFRPSDLLFWRSENNQIYQANWYQAGPSNLLMISFIEAVKSIIDIIYRGRENTKFISWFVGANVVRAHERFPCGGRRSGH